MREAPDPPARPAVPSPVRDPAVGPGITRAPAATLMAPVVMAWVVVG
jgi:hypothetical protein